MLTQASPAVASIAGIPVSIAGITAVTQNITGAAVHQVPKVGNAYIHARTCTHANRENISGAAVQEVAKVSVH